nr:type II toxin-antitoxin system RelE/ParE family toxin [uncultured Sphingomonas sp.]
MARVVRSPAALRDAARIWAYVALDNVAAADALVDRLDEKLTLLAENPGLGTPRPEFRADLRSVAVGNYVIFYTPFPDGIRVVRILHGARHVGRALR